MKLIYKNNKLRLNQIKKDTFSMTFDDEFNMFNKFYKQNLDMSNTNGFIANNVISLIDLLKKHDNELNYNLCKQLFINLSEQISIILKNNIAPLSIDSKDIFFIENKKGNCFIFLNLDNVFVVDNNNIVIETPFRQDKFFSPELKSIKSFPIRISEKSIYYSLGLQVVNCLNKFSEKITNEYDFKQHMEMIKETKLYWALLRCLENNPENRFCLYI